MYLESLCHQQNCFVTLTYSQEKLPDSGSLVPRHVTNWLKRYRKSASTSVRYFLCGEYGDETFRPHYHAALFGVEGCMRGRTLRVAGSSRPRWDICCPNCILIGNTWGFGDVDVGTFALESAQYVAGYVVKKMTFATDPRLQGRHPEFARMSRRPGIGAAAMTVLSEQLHTDHGLDEVAALGDVPHQLRLGKKSIPLGRYLRRILREEIGMPEHLVQAARDRFTQEKSLEVLSLLKNSLNSSASADTAQSVIVAENLGRIRSVEARSKLRPHKGSL